MRRHNWCGLHLHVPSQAQSEALGHLRQDHVHLHSLEQLDVAHSASMHQKVSRCLLIKLPMK